MKPQRVIAGLQSIALRGLTRIFDGSCNCSIVGARSGREVWRKRIYDAQRRQMREFWRHGRLTQIFRQPGVDEIRLPGERSARERQRLTREGLTSDRKIYETLRALCSAIDPGLGLTPYPGT